VKNSAATGLALICLGTVAAVGLLELLGRVAPGLMPPQLRMIDHVYEARHAWEDMMEADAYLGFKLKPGLKFQFPSEGRKVGIQTVDFGLGDIGFRDIGTSPPFDMLAVGDSFAFCDDAPVESCWVRRLADATGLSVGTLGVNGYSSLAEARVLERYGRTFRPRIVLLSVFINDFKDNVNFNRWLTSGSDDFWLWMRRKRRSALVDKLTRVSIVFRLIDGAARYRTKRVHHYQDGDIEFVFRTDPWWTKLVSDTETRAGWQLMRQALDDAKKTASSIGARLVVLLFPFKEQVYWKRVRNFMPNAAELDVDAPFRVVAKHLGDQGVDYCDLTEGFRREAEKGRQLYLRVSGHWNDDGHAVAAGLIGGCLARRGFLAKTVTGRVAIGNGGTKP